MQHKGRYPLQRLSPTRTPRMFFDCTLAWLYPALLQAFIFYVNVVDTELTCQRRHLLSKGANVPVKQSIYLFRCPIIAQLIQFVQQQCRFANNYPLFSVYQRHSCIYQMVSTTKVYTTICHHKEKKQKDDICLGGKCPFYHFLAIVKKFSSF